MGAVAATAVEVVAEALILGATVAVVVVVAPAALMAAGCGEAASMVAVAPGGSTVGDAPVASTAVECGTEVSVTAASPMVDSETAGASTTEVSATVAWSVM
jgi:hypothetical protein